jgi:hypothetical protein
MNPPDAMYVFLNALAVGVIVLIMTAPIAAGFWLIARRLIDWMAGQELAPPRRRKMSAPARRPRERARVS